MASSGDVYQPSGTFNPISTLTAALGGVVAALIVAAIVWAWERSPIPTLVILTPLLQGFALGLVLTLLFGAARLRNPMLGFLLGLICGVISVAAVHYGHYVSDVYTYRDQVREQAAEITQALGPEGAAAFLGEVGTAPFRAFDEDIIYPSNGRRGFVGYLYLRAESGVAIRRMEVTGTGMWVLWAVEALLVTGIAAAMGRSRAAEPFCEKCDKWLASSETPTAVPPEKAGPLAELVHKGDALGLAALRSSTPAFDPARGSAVAVAHTCSGCDDGYVDVVLRTPSGEKVEEKRLARLVHAPKEMLAALRADVQPAEQEPAEPNPPPAPTGATAG